MASTAQLQVQASARSEASRMLAIHVGNRYYNSWYAAIRYGCEHLHDRTRSSRSRKEVQSMTNPRINNIEVPRTIFKNYSGTKVVATHWHHHPLHIWEHATDCEIKTILAPEFSSQLLRIATAIPQIPSSSADIHLELKLLYKTCHQPIAYFPARQPFWFHSPRLGFGMGRSSPSKTKSRASSSPRYPYGSSHSPT